MPESKKPSDFCVRPWDSVLGNSESETIALNIMRILKRTGDTFRELSFEEYEKERKKDGGYSSGEKSYFAKVIGYCRTESTARLFSNDWDLVEE